MTPIPTAIAIWKRKAEHYIAQTQTKAYQIAAGYLRKVQPLLGKLGRDEEWQAYLSGVRQNNIRKWRLVEILDSLAGRPIVEGL